MGSTPVEVASTELEGFDPDVVDAELAAAEVEVVGTNLDTRVVGAAEGTKCLTDVVVCSGETAEAPEVEEVRTGFTSETAEEVEETSGDWEAVVETSSHPAQASEVVPRVAVVAG